MTRLNAIHPDNATGKTKELFTAVNSKLGVVPNMMRTMGQSPALLEGYLHLSTALGGGTLSAQTGGLIAMAVAESNACNYCLSAHTYINTNLMKVDAGATEAAREAHSADAKTDAILQFAKEVTLKKGNVTDADVATVKAAGVTDAEIAETIGHVALNILTNYFNITAGTEIDFPVVRAHALATV